MWWYEGKVNRKGAHFPVACAKTRNTGKPKTEQVVKTWLKVALNTILQRFEYHICIDNFSVGKCLSQSTR